jgi:hypothetical protein
MKRLAMSGTARNAANTRHGVRVLRTCSTASPIRQRSPSTAAVQSTPVNVRFSPTPPGSTTCPSSAAQNSRSSAA